MATSRFAPHCRQSTPPGTGRLQAPFSNQEKFKSKNAKTLFNSHTIRALTGIENIVFPDTREGDIYPLPHPAGAPILLIRPENLGGCHTAGAKTVTCTINSDSVR
jgi:hypothetical protein